MTTRPPAAQPESDLSRPRHSAPEPSVQFFRVLVVDDNSDIHEDIRKILASRRTAASLKVLEHQVFGDAASDAPPAMDFEIDGAYQGDEAVARAQKAIRDHRPYSVAFVDMRMPPGQDGLQTILQIWEFDPDVQIVCCSAYADYSWDQMLKATGISDRLVFLRKPYDPFEVLQLAHTLAAKWSLQRFQRDRLLAIETVLSERRQDIENLTASASLLLDNTRDLVAFLAHDGFTTLSSATLRTTLGREDEELRKAQLASYVHPDDQPMMERAIRCAVSGQPSQSFMCRLQHANGSWTSTELRAVAAHGAPWITPILILGRSLDANLA